MPVPTETLADDDGGAVDIIFAAMPWATTTRPSIALGILDRLCDEAGVRCLSLFPNLDMAALIGLDAARPMADERALYGLGEHLFAVDLFGREALDSDGFLELMCRLPLPPPYNDLAYVRRLRDEVVPVFLDGVAARMLASGAAVYGFTATFNQVMASLAMARRIKAVRPDAVILAGGACFDGEMGQEYHRALPQLLTHVFMGEAEESFREFLARWKAGQSTAGIPGVTYVEDGDLRLVSGHAVEDMDASPMPNYFPFFQEVAAIRARTGIELTVEALPFEGSRGCWWGQKNHCVFCGINKDLLGFREKSVDRVVDEMLVLTHLHGVPKLTATDWIISRKSRTEILERLRGQDLDIEVFYETRSDLAKDEIRLLRDSGALRVQPGIESFSTPVLKLMRKGTTGIRQIRFLKWAREYGVKASYNILCGFPGDAPDWYLEMADVIEQVPHLQPPTSNANFVELHRFSPLFMRPKDFGIHEYELRVDYRFNFPQGLVDPLKVGYFFEYRSDMIADPTQYIDRVRAVIRPWIENWEGRRLPRCDYLIGPEFVQVHDGRPVAGESPEARTLILRGLAKDAFLLLDDVRTDHELATLLAAKYPRQVADGVLARTVEEFIASRLVLREGNMLLALPIAIKPRGTRDLETYVVGAAPAALAAE
ncbi:MAG: RiPP maturation radical SAM C-methyltransferase [Azospirillaceae bacterium]|nr:RiPP maturation radical SAM C-methyltransferase [Azospirillaceae bacterium]